MAERAQWRVKAGKHVLRTLEGTKRYVPGERFSAYDFEVESFKDQLERLSPEPPPEKDLPLAPGRGPKMVPRKRGGTFDVLTADGKKINKKPLTEEEARSLVSAAE